MMTKRRSSSGLIGGRPVAILSTAMEEGRLSRGEQERAEELLSIGMPTFRRLPRHAKASLTKRALSQAETHYQESSGQKSTISLDDVDAVAREVSVSTTMGQDTASEMPVDEGGADLPQAPSANGQETPREEDLGAPPHRNDLSTGHLNRMLPYNRPKTSVRSNQDAVGDGSDRATNPERKRRRANPSASVMRGTPDGGQQQSALVERPSIRYADVGGINHVVDEVRELIEIPLLHVELYKHLGVDPPRGILLHGPPGCGKTLLANAIAGELGVPFLKISAPEIVSGMSGESERRLRDLMAEGKQHAPCIVFIDEVDAVCSRRESAHKDMEKRIVAQLLTCMDDLSLEKTDGKPVIVIGATNRPDAIDPALRRAGRFDRELEIGAPDEASRAQILRSLSLRLRLSGDFDFDVLARKTAGFVGADLSSLTTMAASVAVRRINHTLFPRNEPVPVSDGAQETKEAETGELKTDAVDEDLRPCRVTAIPPENLESLCISMDDFLRAIPKVQPSALREGFTTVPDVTWKNVGALDELRRELDTAVVEPIRHPEKFIALGLRAPAGVLLYGPPGCGKTLLAKAVACESSANFISVKGPELLNKFVGESERSVRRLFQRARASAPCVVFFDELDALAPRRSGDGMGGGLDSSSSTERVVNQLLTELDGMDSRKQVFVIAATNRPDIIDPAMLRPGRLDKLLYVPLPSREERVSILQTVATGTPLDEGVELAKIAESPQCEGYSGADIAALVREAAVCALRANRTTVREEDFTLALSRVFPSVSQRDAKLYRDLKGKIRKSRIQHESPDT